jgi:hypothetical protein
VVVPPEERALAVSVVMHELRVVRNGRRRLIPVSELERWLDAKSWRRR